MVFLYHCTDDESSESSDEYSDVTINIRELDDVLMKDVGNRIAQSGKYVTYVHSSLSLC